MPPDLISKGALDALTSFQSSFARELEGEWLEFERRRLERLFLSVSLPVLQRLVARSRHADAIKLANRVLDIDPLNDTAARALIQSLLSEGHFRGADRFYRDYLQLLHQEIGEKPPSDLQALMEAAASRLK